jgi:ABC-type lipoprotein export system ATPase subunit
MLMVTHQHEILPRFDRVVNLGEDAGEPAGHAEQGEQA